MLLKRKVLVVPLCLVLLLAASAGAWSGGAKEPGGTAYTIKLATWEADIPADNAVVRLLSQKLGANIQMVVLPHGVTDGSLKLNTLLAANDFPDIVPSIGDSKLISDGLASFSLDELKTNMPRYVKAILDSVGSTSANLLWSSHWADAGKTQMKTISSVWADGSLPYGGAWRWDKLQAAGVTSVPTTVQEFGDALAKVKAKWPDKFPINPRGKYQWQCFTTIFGAYGVTSNWEYHDGQLVPGLMTANAKLAYAVLQDWFKKGYINPEFVTNDDAWADFKRGDAVWIDWPGWWYLSDKNTSSSVLEEMRKIDPNAEGVMSPLIKSELYPNVQPTWNVFNPLSLGPAGVGFGAQLGKDKAKLHKAMEVLDRLTFDDEIALIAAFGIEGKHWTRSEDGKSVTIAKDYPQYSAQAIAEGVHAQVYTPLSSMSVANNYLYTKDYWTAKAEYQKIVGWTADTWVNRFKFSLVTGPLKDDSGNDLAPIQANLDKLTSQAFVWLVTGEKPISYFDDYVSQWKSQGGDKLIEAATRDYVKMWKDAGIIK